MSKFIVATLFVVLGFHGLATAQKIESCGANIFVSLSDGASSTSIHYDSKECMTLKEELEAERAFREPNRNIQQRLYVSFSQGIDDSKGAYTLVVLKDGKVVARETSGVPTKRSRGRDYPNYYGFVSWWGDSDKPLVLPFECVLMTTYGSKHELRFTVSELPETKTK